MTPSLLLTMNDDVMRKILENVDYCGIQTLRKTCHSLRNFIDDTLPSPSTSSITIIVEPEIISFDLNFSTFDLPLGIVYHKKENGTLIEKVMQFEEATVSPQKLKFLENSDFMESFFSDFQIFLKFLKSQKSPLQHFEFTLCAVNGSEFCKKMRKILEESETLTTSSLTLRVHNAFEVLSFLPNFRARNLKRIEISNSKRTDDDLNLARVSELEQWKKAETVVVNFFTVRGPERFLGFSKSLANFMTIREEEAKVMVESFRTLPNFKSCQLNYIYLDEPIFGALGAHPFIDQDYLGRARRRWFRKTLDPRKILLIELNPKFILFKKIGLEGVPENAVLED